MQAARMVRVQMRDNHPVHRIGRDAQRGERCAWAHRDRAAPRAGLVPVIAGIDKDHLVTTPQHPDEIIHRVRDIMAVVEQETVAPYPCVAVRIFDGMNLPIGHGNTSSHVSTCLAVIMAALARSNT